MSEAPHQPVFTHKVRCDVAHWERSRRVYWIVVGALWDHADSFMLQDYGRESVLPKLMALPGVKPVSHQVNSVAGRTSESTKALLLRASGDLWFSLTLYTNRQPIFYDEDGGDTMQFVAQDDTLERLAAEGVTDRDLIVLRGGGV